MAIVIDGDGTVTGISVGGLPDGIVDAGTLATNSVDSAELIDGSIDNSHISSSAAITASKLTGIVTDTTTIENNIALLGFYRAADNSKAKYSLVDQVIDEYTDATGIDAGNSTNEELISGYYRGTASSSGNATGGTITDGGGGYKVHTFTADGNFVAPSSASVDYLVVAGGGGGGRGDHSSSPSGKSAGGGGGAGGVLQASSYSIISSVKKG